MTESEGILVTGASGNLGQLARFELTPSNRRVSMYKAFAAAMAIGLGFVHSAQARESTAPTCQKRLPATPR